MKLRCLPALALLLAALAETAAAAPSPLARRLADAALARWPAASASGWSHDRAALLAGIQAEWLETVDPRYFNFLRSSVDPLLAPDGALPAIRFEQHRLTDFQLGNQLLLLSGVTQDPRYFKAATRLYVEFRQQPRTASGGFWQSQSTPNQMTPDGIDEAMPFYAAYARTFHHPEAFADITRQFTLVQQRARDPRTGLLHQSWDASRRERWADKTTGMSATAWGRGMGWFLAALVDTLPSYPDRDPGRDQLLGMLRADAAAAARVQDPATGLWFQVLDKPGAPGNFPEASASCLFVYALAKGVRLGYLPQRYRAVAESGYNGILKRFIQTAPDGSVTIAGTVEATDLGGHPYHDGSYAYYTGEKTIAGDPKGVGTFLMAAGEMDNIQNARLGRGRTVTIDAWFNSQKRPDPTGREVYYHYKWDDWSPAGYSLFGHLFEDFGAQLATLDTAPTVASLSRAQVYIVASPDIPAKNPHPHYATPEDARQIAAWVRAGGVFVILENDTSFADLDHFNAVAAKFGMHFNSVLRKHVIGADWAMGKIAVGAGGPIFHHPHTLYVKDVCTIALHPPARSLLSENGDTFMAMARYGQGTVLAMTDPWLYNEYTDGRKLPAQYDNYAAGREFVRWILEQKSSR
ncbi:MAG: glycoside hydrolase family 88 protein [Acidobacteriota bacterium]